jgi:cob(I)alamin adenosyltransferase
MKIYTKTGDEGFTSLIGGKRVEKHNQRIEAYGTIDELISFTGLVRDSIDNESIISILVKIQDNLMTCASILASDCDDCKLRIPELKDEAILFLEKEIDEMDKKLPPLKSFILPGGHLTVSYCHVARSICRRTEREVIRVTENHHVPANVIKYINRLSDYFFILARFLSIKFNAVEIPWKPIL